jgi:hypothetical protein
MVRPFGVCVQTGSLLLLPGGSTPASMDLSKATKLENLVFRPELWRVDWIITALQSITPKHRDLRGISISVPHDLPFGTTGLGVWQAIGEAVFGQWLDLDRLLVQLWESHLIRRKVVCTTRMEERGTIGHVGCLLPEATKAGMIDLVESPTGH